MQHSETVRIGPLEIFLCKEFAEPVSQRSSPCLTEASVVAFRKPENLQSFSLTAVLCFFSAVWSHLILAFVTLFYFFPSILARITRIWGCTTLHFFSSLPPCFIFMLWIWMGWGRNWPLLLIFVLRGVSPQPSSFIFYISWEYGGLAGSAGHLSCLLPSPEEAYMFGNCSG